MKHNKIRLVGLVLLLAPFHLISDSSSHLSPFPEPTSGQDPPTMANHQGGNTGPSPPGSGGWTFRSGSGVSPDGSWGYRWGHGSSPGGYAFGYGSGSARVDGNGPSGGFGFGWGGGSGPNRGPNQNGFGGPGPFGFGFGGNFGAGGHGFHHQSWFGGFPAQQPPRPNGPPGDVAGGGGGCGSANARR